MADRINIHDSRGSYIEFDEAPSRLQATRTAFGFRLKLPAEITLRQNNRAEPAVLVTNLFVKIFTTNREGRKLELGIALDRLTWFSTIPGSKTSLDLVWEGALEALGACERTRDGRSPAFDIELNGEVCFLLQQDLAPVAGRLRTEPQQFHGTTRITYPTETWVEMLREIGVSQAVYLEIPCAGTPPSGWESVWEHLENARASFDRGGETAWRNCVSSAREALTQWSSLEALQHGPGYQSPKADHNLWKTRTKKQRLDTLRWFLRDLCHPAAHGTAGDWSREDALVVYGTLCALLAARDP